jgi:hypothetical protein
VHNRSLRLLAVTATALSATLFAVAPIQSEATSNPNVPVVAVEPPATTTSPPTLAPATSTVVDTLPPEAPVTTQAPIPATTTAPKRPETTTTTPTTTAGTPGTPGTPGDALLDPSLNPVCASIAKPVPLRPGRPCRIVAYYGTPLSKGMGILGRLPRNQVVASLRADVERWMKADPETDVVCAFEIIAITAQAAPGPTGLYRARITPDALNEMIALARESSCLIILDLQVGWSSVPVELPYFNQWLSQPDVHLALDPEWDMPPGVKPGKQIGSMDAGDINNAISTLRQIVRIPIAGQPTRPKLLIVHRFRDFMIKNPEQVAPSVEVRLLVNMDGFGPPKTKIGVYGAVRRGLATNLTGFKLFTNPKNDNPLLQPNDVVGLTPAPMFINYQ